MEKKIDFRILRLMIQGNGIDDDKMSLFFSDVYNDAEKLYRSIYRAGYERGVSDVIDNVKQMYEDGVIVYIGYPDND